MTQLNERMLALAKRFAALAAEEQRNLQGRMIEQGLSFDLLPIPPRDTEIGTVQASYAQQRLWLLWQLNPDSSAYNQPALLRLRGVLDAAQLEQSLQALIDRHEALRTNFCQQEQQVLQVLHPQRRFSLQQLDLRGASDAQARAEAQVLAQSTRPFDLEQDLLLRASLLRTAEQEYLLVFCTHHIVTDAWSMPILIEEVTRHYAGLGVAQPLPIQYADYARWQRLWLQAGEAERQLGYWRERLGEAPMELELPLDHARAPQRSERGARCEIDVPPAIGAAVRRLAAEQGCTPFMVLLAALQVLLFRYSGATVLRVGSPVANRTRAEVEGLIGFFVNTQVLQVELDGQQAFSAVLAQVKQRVLQAQAHQDLPFEQLVDALQPQRSLNRTPLFQVLFNHQVGAGHEARWQLPGLELEALGSDVEFARFDLSLNTQEQGDSLKASFVYACELFEHATIERLGQHWAELLGAALASPEQAIETLALRPGAVLEQLLAGQAAALHAAPVLAVHRRFEWHAARTPDVMALVEGEQTLSYAALNQQANRLAQRLRAAGLGAESVVAIAAERSLAALTGMLAVLKAGAAYVALDPQYPRARLAQMLEDSRAALLLAPAAWVGQFTRFAGLQVWSLDDEAALAGFAVDNLDDPVLAEQPAYVIFTSGSTGRAKGVCVSHGALGNYLDGIEQRLPLADVRSMALVSTLAADLGHTVLFGALAGGRTLHLIDPDRAVDGEAFAAYMQQHDVDALKIVPSHLGALLGSDNLGVLPRRCLILGGEAAPAALVQRIQRLAPACRLINHYGPTEATVGALTCALDTDTSASPALGAVLANVRGYVLDNAAQLAPFGCHGELYLGGAGLARGYLGQPGLTAERFVPDPFSAKGERLYRTGDRVRYRSNGHLEFIGRVDQQLKIRGYRVEPGEIEQQLLAHEQVRECVVLAQPGSNGVQLVAYVVAVPGAAPPPDVLQAFLRDKVSAHQLPRHIVVLDALPLTLNGKLDRRALPLPETRDAQLQRHAPHTELQARLLAVWEQVLGRTDIGMNDNFFELGGDSIIAIQMVSRARQAGLQLSARDVFAHQSVEALAGVTREAGQRLQSQAPVTGEAALTPIQQWFFDTPIAQRHHWNQAVLLAPRQGLDAELLRQALACLIEQHDALRLRYAAHEQGWRQWHGAAEPQVLWVRQARDQDELLAHCEQAQASLGLDNGQICRAVLLNLADGSQRLLLAIHHLVVDGVSWRILLEDLQQAYRALAAGQAPNLPAKTSALRDWAEHLREYAGSAALLAQLDGWRHRLSGVDADLPRDKPVLITRNREARAVSVQLPEALTRQLLQASAGAYRTQINDLLLAALAQTVCAWTGYSDALVRLEGHGREDLFDSLDLSRSVGWFTSLYPVRLTPASDPATCIKTIKEQLRSIPGNGLGYGVLRYLAAPAVREQLAALPSPRITFNYLGQFDQSFDGEALFSPAAEASGDVRDAEAPLGNWLTVNAQVYGGCLGLSWTYSSEMFERATIERLAEDYLAALQALVLHCSVDGVHGVTPSDFPLAGLSQAQLDHLPVAPAAIADILPLTPMQQGMLFHSLFQPSGSAYLNQMRLQVRGLDLERFVAAWQGSLDRHDSLRASFHWQQGLEQPLQIVHRQLDMPLQRHDWQRRSDLPAALEALAVAELEHGFVLEQGPLLRVQAIQTAPDEWHLIQTSHHILMDGWSSSRLLGEVLQRYAGQAPGGTAGGYRPYLNWLAEQPADLAERFWKGQLAQLGGPIRLADALHDPRAPSVAPGTYSERVSQLSLADSERLKAFARRQKVTVNSLLQAAWLLLLKRYTQQPCVAFGATVSGRPAQLPGIEEQLGLFINTLPVIASPEPQLTVQAWVQRVQALNLALRDHEHTPLYEIQRWAGQSGEALFDHILIFENYPVSAALEQGAPAGLSFTDVSKRERTSYPLTLSAGLEQVLVLQYSHACEVFSERAIEQLDRHLQALLLAFCDDERQCLGNLGLLDPVQQRQMVSEWNDTTVAFADHHCLHSLIEASAARAPHAPALSVAGEVLDYAQLNARANRLAHKLREAGVGPDVLVGIAVERGVELIVGLLAILKAGGAYVPMDPEYPADRLAHMIEDSGTRLLLTQAQVRQALPVPAEVQVIDLLPGDDWLQGYSADNLANLGGPANLAYVIYTSGSTGKPKGVGVRHDGVLNFLASMLKQPGIAACDRVLSLTSLSFDIAGLELYGTLLAGGCIVLVDRHVARDPQALLAVIGSEQVSVVQATPSTWRMLLDSPQAEKLAGCKVLCGGEALAPDLAARLIERCGHVWNLYGPTETTIWSALHYLDAAQPQALLGRPLDNTALLVLDADLQPVPIGVAGELYIGGAGLARGYHQRPALTAERFMASPFARGERIYRTGDLARFDADGRLEYIGRVDHQVKIRGFRIELGEIEAQLLAHPQVREAAVVACESAVGTQLIGYVVPSDDALLGAESEAQQALRDALRAALGTVLPEFMVPAQLLLLARMPLTPNGKLDRKALPAPDASLAQRRFEAPQSELEQQLATIWADVLKLERVGLADNFFELGGHSLLATQATARAQQLLCAPLPLDAMFRAKSLRDYAVCIAPHLNTDIAAHLSDMHDFLTELELE